MRITTRGRYALRASMALAKLGEKGLPVSINTLSNEENVSAVFLEQIFFKLKKADIVRSVRGPGGGFAFARPLDSISVREIFFAAGEELDVLPCDRSIEDCDRLSGCICHKLITSATGLINKYFSEVSLQMLLVNKEFRPVTKEKRRVKKEKMPCSQSKRVGNKRC